MIGPTFHCPHHPHHHGVRWGAARDLRMRMGASARLLHPRVFTYLFTRTLLEEAGSHLKLQGGEWAIRWLEGPKPRSVGNQCTMTNAHPHKSRPFFYSSGAIRWRRRRVKWGLRPRGHQFLTFYPPTGHWPIWPEVLLLTSRENRWKPPQKTNQAQIKKWYGRDGSEHPRSSKDRKKKKNNCKKWLAKVHQKS